MKFSTCEKFCKHLKLQQKLPFEKKRWHIFVMGTPLFPVLSDNANNQHCVAKIGTALQATITG
jgi:hypothetical protein